MLKEMTKAGESSDDNSSMVESTSALLHNPDVISSDSVDNALGVFDAASQRSETAPDVVDTAFVSIANLIFVSSALRKENDQTKNSRLVGQGEELSEEEQHKKYSMQFMRVTDDFIDGVNLETFDELGEMGLTISTRLLKARKVQV